MSAWVVREKTNVVVVAGGGGTYELYTRRLRGECVIVPLPRASATPATAALPSPATLLPPFPHTITLLLLYALMLLTLPLMGNTGF